jgi:hypothetical protein
MPWRKEQTGVCSKSVHYVLTGLLFVILSADLAAPDSARAEEEYGIGKDRFKIYLGGYFPSINSDLTVDRGDDEIDLDDV